MRWVAGGRIDNRGTEPTNKELLSFVLEDNTVIPSCLVTSVSLREVPTGSWVLATDD